MSPGEAFIFRNKNLLCNKDTRLVTWIVDLLHENIQKVIAMRKSIKTNSTPVEIKNVAYHNPSHGITSMDEVQDVLATPEFCERAFNEQEDYRSVQVSPKAMAQLHELITTIAGMYHKNPFHSKWFYQRNLVIFKICPLFSDSSLPFFKSLIFRF